ncbi:unnamed protein product [Leptosia nina]|uniref:Uncharacterized protein n=1 Tax=Leptosia nina TaxID=320188 RepID=A0AAV1JF94_9NEOP
MTITLSAISRQGDDKMAAERAKRSIWKESTVHRPPSPGKICRHDASLCLFIFVEIVYRMRPLVAGLDAIPDVRRNRLRFRSRRALWLVYVYKLGKLT